jgi:hypothetical protein
VSKFTKIVDSIKEQLDEDLPGNTIQFAKTENERHAFTSPNRVLWINRPGGTFDAVDGIGAELHAQEDTGDTVASNAILTNVLDVEAHIWGADEDTAEMILENVVRAMNRRLTLRGHDPVKWENLTQVPENAGRNVYGSAFVLFTTFKSPVLDVVDQATATMLTHTETGEYVSQLPVHTGLPEVDP